MHSALYTGRVEHVRRAPHGHAFRNRLFLLYLDLDELDGVFDGRWFWSVERANLASWRRSDYLGDPATPLKQAVLDRVGKELGRTFDGPVRMLTHLRYFGYCFNPVTFYYGFDPTGEELEFVLAEITNTPWDERHAYVLDARRGESVGDALRWGFDKTFHVSPFFSMEQRYTWQFSAPRESLGVRMENHEDGQRVFDVSLDLERRPLDGRALAGALLRHPWMTARVTVAIYWQALRLWWKRTPFFPHPGPHPEQRPATAESREA